MPGQRHTFPIRSIYALCLRDAAFLDTQDRLACRDAQASPAHQASLADQVDPVVRRLSAKRSRSHHADRVLLARRVRLVPMAKTETQGKFAKFTRQSNALFLQKSRTTWQTRKPRQPRCVDFISLFCSQYGSDFALKWLFTSHSCINRNLAGNPGPQGPPGEPGLLFCA